MSGTSGPKGDNMAKGKGSKSGLLKKVGSKGMSSHATPGKHVKSVVRGESSKYIKAGT